MKPRTLGKPSPAIIVSVLALVAALAGTAVAGPEADTAAKKVTKNQAKKVAKKQDKKYFNNNIGDASVASAQSAQTASSASTATNADNATNAQNATAANGVRPVSVNFAADANSGETVFVNEGGIQIAGECTVDGHAQLNFTPTAQDGALHIRRSNQQDGTKVLALNDWDAGFEYASADAFPDVTWAAALSFRGSTGTTVTGQLLWAQDADFADCVIGGTLFVG